MDLSLHTKLAKDLLDRLFLFLEARFGATVEQAFTDTFTAQQRQDFSTQQGVILSAADAEFYDEREQQRQRRMENLQDDDSEPEDMDGPTDWVITDIRLHVPGSHRVAAQHRIKDQATASTMHSLQVDAASDPDLEKHFVNLQEEMADTNTQLPALKFASLKDIPFCFNCQVPPEWNVPCPQGAYMQEVSPPGPHPSPGSKPGTPGPRF